MKPSAHPTLLWIAAVAAALLLSWLVPEWGTPGSRPVTPLASHGALAPR